MPRFRRKPTTVEAEQWDGHADATGLCRCVADECGRAPHVHTINGAVVRLRVGDWLIREPDGHHFYPCDPDVFKATYERVD